MKFPLFSDGIHHYSFATRLTMVEEVAASQNASFEAPPEVSVDETFFTNLFSSYYAEQRKLRWCVYPCILLFIIIAAVFMELIGIGSSTTVLLPIGVCLVVLFELVVRLSNVCGGAVFLILLLSVMIGPRALIRNLRIQIARTKGLSHSRM